MIRLDSEPRHRAFALPGSTPHYGPDKIVDVEHIDLHLVPDLRNHALDGVCTTTVRALDEDVARLEMDAVDFTVSAVERNATPQRFEQRDNALVVHFDPPIRAGEQATFMVTYRVERPRHGLFFVEPTPEYPNKVAHCWTQCQDSDARYWLPCLDYPHEKQTTSTTVVVPRGLFALANGALVESRDDGEHTIFTYRQDVPHSTYLLTFVVGPFVEMQQRSGEKPVYYYVLPGREADGERSFGKTPKMIEVFEERLRTPYPYARYSQIAVSDFIFGGMENTSATTQTDRTLHDARAHLDFTSDGLVAHELAHQWFGDLLTCRDWSHAWLNEGFATFFELVFREADLGRDEYLYGVFESVERYLNEDRERYTRPIVCNRYRDHSELFDRHLYEKGAAVLHMLRGELGEARFWRSLARYVADNAQRNVETIDLIRAIEAATGRNMRAFFDQWVFRAGHPELEVKAAWDDERRAVTVTVDQKQRCDDENPPFHFGVDIAFVDGAGKERRVHCEVERAHETVTVPLDERPRLVRFDPGAHLLGDVGYAFGTSFAAAALREDTDPVARIRAARELAKDGSSEARAAIAGAFAGEAFWGVLAQTAAALGKTRAPWAREILLGALSHTHPKVRRAVATALGEFKDEVVAGALIDRARDDESYFVRAAALYALGKTRDARAFETLSAALKETTWDGTVESGAARGLGELADPRATVRLIAATQPGGEETLRRAALDALARVANLVESERTPAIEAIERCLDDPALLVRLSALAAAQSTADKRLLDALDRLERTAFDARLRRGATEAAMRIREAQTVPIQVSALRSDLDDLREEHRKFQEKIEQISRT